MSNIQQQVIAGMVIVKVTEDNLQDDSLVAWLGKVGFNAEIYMSYGNRFDEYRSDSVAFWPFSDYYDESKNRTAKVGSYLTCLAQGKVGVIDAGMVEILLLTERNNP